MARLRKPTSSNRAASVDIRRQLLARIAELHATADGAFVAATQTTDPEQSLAHRTAAHAARVEILVVTLELASAVLLAGTPAQNVATGSGISTATLTRNNPPYMAGLRGHDLVQDPAAPYGWRVAAT